MALINTKRHSVKEKYREITNQEIELKTAELKEDTKKELNKVEKKSKKK